MRHWRSSPSSNVRSHFPTEDGGTPLSVRRPQTPARTRTVGPRPPSRSSVCSGREDRAGQRCEHYFTALFITAHLRSVTTSSPVEWNTSCHADAIMGWIQSLSKTCAEPTCTSSPSNTYLSNTEHSLFFKIMNVLTSDGLLRTSFSFFF